MANSGMAGTPSGDPEKRQENLPESEAENLNLEDLKLPSFKELAELNLSTEASLSKLIEKIESFKERIEELKGNPEALDRLREDIVLEIERLLNVYANNISLIVGKLLSLFDGFPGVFDDDKVLSALTEAFKEKLRALDFLSAELKGLVGELKEGMELEELVQRLEVWQAKVMDLVTELEALEGEFMDALASLEDTDEIIDELSQELPPELDEELEGEAEELDEEITEEDLDEEPTEEEIASLMALDESELESFIQGQLRKIYDELEEAEKLSEAEEEDIDISKDLSSPDQLIDEIEAGDLEEPGDLSDDEDNPDYDSGR